MAKEFFIPNWYIDRKNKTRDKIIKVVLGILISLIILMSICILNIYTKIKIISKEINQENNQSNIVSSSEPVKQGLLAIEKYKEIIDYFEKNNLNYNNLLMDKGSFQLDIKVKDHEEYINVIKCIEKQYSIKHLTLLSKSKKDYEFKVIF
jgi:cell division protein FtsL